MRHTLLLTAALAAASSPHTSAQNDTQPFSIDDLVRVKRVSDPRVSPDGRHVAFVLRETDMEANRGRTDIWLLALGERGAEPRRLTRHDANDSSPRWAPDSRTLYFLSERSDSSQVWRLSLDGGEALQVSDYPLGVSALEVSPTGERIAFAMQVFPDCRDLACTKKRLEEVEKSPDTARAYERLLPRHWDTWKDGTRSQLFSAPLTKEGKTGTPVSLSGRIDADVPSKPFGGEEDFTFSPDGRRVVFSARAAGRTEAWSTNFDLFEVPADGSKPPVNLTADNPAWDAQPVFLPGGELAWLAMERAGFEADRFRVRLRNARGEVRELTRDFDRSFGHLAVQPGTGRLLATADDLGQTALFAIDPRGGAPRKLVATGQVADFSAARDSIVFAWASLAAPPDLFVVGSGGGEPVRLTAVNRELLAGRALGEVEQFSFTGAKGDTVYGYIVKPPRSAPGARHPVAFFVHGGPQSSLQNRWSYRWNGQVFAGAGYAFIDIDFHGSPGYGQAFTDAVSGDWGGAPLEDLQKGLAAALERYPSLDGGRICALGASYGGFMMNWLAGHWSEPFRCFVNHAGIFDQRAMYYSTEELWFPEWEFGGPYHADPASYEKWNPVNAVERWRVPMLVTHGQLDFRVPYTQGLATFTALQRRGIDSRLLVFPDENHWVLKPANAVRWYGAMLGWLDRYLE